MNHLTQNLVDKAYSKLKNHIRELDEILYSLECIKEKNSEKRIMILNSTIKVLSEKLAIGVYMGNELNRDLAALHNLKNLIK